VANRTVRVPQPSIAGGDVDRDQDVDLFDLVRVGADYRSAPPNDPDADCNDDGHVNLFDLVMVGSNYGRHGPLPWTGDQTAVDAANAGDAVASIAKADRVPVSAMPAVRFGRAGDPAVAAVADASEDGEVVVKVIARGVEQLYGADFALSFDPAALRVQDADPERSGVQVAPGAIWSDGAAFVARNQVDSDLGSIRFAASRLQPAEPVSGDVVLATVTFRPMDPEAGNAYALSDVRLSDPRGNSIRPAWSGVDPRGVQRIYLPHASLLWAGP